MESPCTCSRPPHTFSVSKKGSILVFFYNTSSTVNFNFQYLQLILKWLYPGDTFTIISGPLIVYRSSVPTYLSPVKPRTSPWSFDFRVSILCRVLFFLIHDLGLTTPYFRTFHLNPNKIWEPSVIFEISSFHYTNLNQNLS